MTEYITLAQQWFRITMVKVTTVTNWHLYRQQYLLAWSPVRTRAAADREAGLYVSLRQVDISPHCDGQSTQLPHDPPSQTCEIPQMTSTVLGPTPSTTQYFIDYW